MPVARATVLPDGELIEAIKRGDEGAFAAMVDAYSPGLLRTARTFVRAVLPLTPERPYYTS